MYNRYIPQSDGTFQRSRVPEQVIRADENPRPVAAPAEEKVNEAEHEPEKNFSSSPPQKKHMQTVPENGSVSGFLRGLLPQNFDTEDLIVVLLLLLISGNGSGDQNAALLTLGIYLFL